MPFLIILSLWAASALASPRELITCEELVLRSAEIALGRAIAATHSPFAHPKKISPVSLAREESRARKILTRSGAKFRTLAAAEMKARKLKTMVAELVEDGALETDPGNYGVLLEILELPTHTYSTDDTDQALTHPQMPVPFAELKRIGVPLLVDTSMGLTDYNGAYLYGPKVVVIRIDTDIYRLLHELKHAEFMAFDVTRFLQEYFNSGFAEERLNRLVWEYPYVEFGNQPLLRAAELLRKGYPVHSLEERLAVETEIQQLRQNWTETDDAEDQEEDLESEIAELIQYADGHLLSDLADRAAATPLNERQRELFLKFLMRIEHDAEFPALQLPHVRDLWVRYRGLIQGAHHPRPSRRLPRPRSLPRRSSLQTP